MNAGIFAAAADEFNKNPLEVLGAVTAILLFIATFFKGVRSFWVRLWRRFTATSTENIRCEGISVNQTASPAITQTFSPTINIHQAEALPVKTASQGPEKPPPPQFKYAGMRERYVAMSLYAGIGVRKATVAFRRPGVAEIDGVTHDLIVQALIFKFENESAGHAMDVVAKLSFRSANRVTEQTIDYGVWVDSPSNCTDIRFGDTRELVICVVVESELFGLDDRREGNHSYHKEAAWLENRAIDGLEFLEIRLLDRRTRVSETFNFRVWRTGNQFNVS